MTGIFCKTILMANPISFKRHSIKALNETRLDLKSDLDQCACHRKWL